MKNIYWVGVRQSDIEDIKHFFNGSITIFGDNRNGNISYCTEQNRINHNIDNKDCDSFFVQTLENLCREDNSVCFLFYNPIYAYRYGEIVKQHTLCLNSYELLETLSNKQRSRHILNNIIKTIPHVILRGTECNYKNIRNYFLGYNEFVIQKAFSSGGEGTFHIDKLSDGHFINSDDEYLISPYLKDSISLNAHIIIFNDNILYLPPSVQIITEIDNRLLYSGGDFICYKALPKTIKAEVLSKTERIAEFVQKKGYRGILGIDFILKDQQLYFMEFNTRFQASSQLVNKALYDHYKISLQEINILSFQNQMAPELKSFDIDYSNFIYTNNNVSVERLKKIYSSKEILNIQTDGYNIDNCCPKEKNVYLSRCIFDRNICSWQNGQIILHPNIYTKDIEPLLSFDNPNYKEYIKIALLNHGVTLSKAAIELAKHYGEIKEAVFDAIDAIIFDRVYVNIPYNCKFSTMSPFTIEVEKDTFVLLFEGRKISTIEIYFVPDKLKDMHTSSMVSYNAIINFATDRIRINPAPVCIYKKNGLSCKFCNLPNTNIYYDLTDIEEVIDYCLLNIEFRHFLIGGGTYSNDEVSWEIIVKIVQYIRKNCQKDIYLMSIPPKDINTLDRLKDAGITEVAFNLEMFDRKLASEIMPGKGKINIEQYMQALKHAVKLWGDTGCVRSLIIYGFDTDNVFLDGIENMCAAGIEPIISIFRPLKNTELSHLNPPPTLKIFSIYEKCKKIAKKYSKILGPDCPMCQNNTLSYTEIE